MACKFSCLPKGGTAVTVGSQLKQTLAALRSARGTLRVYASQAGQIEAKEAYSGSLQEISGIIEDLEERLRVVELAEPQYKGL